MVTDAVVDFLSVARSVTAGSCDAHGVPFATRCAALRLRDDRRHATLFLAQGLAHATVRNVAQTGRLAVQISNPSDHRTLQLKGRVLHTGPAADGDRSFVEGYLRELASVVDLLGMPAERVVRMSHWPAIALELQIDDVYLQTPGPGAGTLLAERAP